MILLCTCCLQGGRNAGDGSFAHRHFLSQPQHFLLQLLESGSEAAVLHYQLVSQGPSVFPAGGAWRTALYHCNCHGNLDLGDDPVGAACSCNTEGGQQA